MVNECPCKTCPKAEPGKGRLIHCTKPEGVECEAFDKWFLKRCEEIQQWKKEKS